mgnify:FL=1
MSSKLKADAIRSMGDEQRKATLVDQARLLMDLKVQRATDRLEAISEIRVTRRNIARLKTILHEKAVKDRHAAAIKLASDEKAARIESKKAEEKAYREIREKNENARQPAAERKKAGVKKAGSKGSKAAKPAKKK